MPAAGHPRVVQHRSEEPTTALPSGRHDVVRAAAVAGIGIAGTLDEVVLHQLLGWHHFYDGSTSTVGLVSDGLFTSSPP